MAIITPPATFPLRRAVWRLTVPTQINVSGWTGRRQAVILPGAARWSVSGEFRPILKQANALQWQGFFASLDGAANSFPVVAVEAQQTTAANPIVSGAGQTGNALNLAGVAGTVGSVFLPAGSKLSIPMPDGSAQLVVLTAAMTVGAGSTGTAVFRPRLRQSPANAATVEARNPYALMALADDVIEWSVDPGQNYGFAFEAEEAF